MVVSVIILSTKHGSRQNNHLKAIEVTVFHATNGVVLVAGLSNKDLLIISFVLKGYGPSLVGYIALCIETHPPII